MIIVMPIYVYACECRHQFEVEQAMTEPPLSECVECGAPAHRVLLPVGVTFKGSGFYKTDSRKTGGVGID